MGIVWKCTMVLLSVLAALIIIVHSEEELEMEYRRNLRPRVSDTAKSNFDQTWRAIDVEPMMRQPTHTNIWNDNSSEEPIKRRMPVRKRRRRPQVPFDEELASEERYVYHEKPGSQYDVYDQTTDLSRRRRKRPEIRPNRWLDESAEFGRPLRRRIQRKKRPLIVENNPQLSEFDNYQPREIISDVDSETSTHQYSLVNTEKFNIDDEHANKHFVYKESSVVTENNSDRVKQSKLETRPNDAPETTADDGFIPVPIDNEDMNLDRPKFQDDKSLSEFSLELAEFKSNDENKDIQKYPDKIRARVFKSPNIKAKNNAPIDPLTLKELLKRSNGRSLSEILQQHNLSLADLLGGREKAISVLRSDDSTEYRLETKREPLQIVKVLSENNHVIDKSSDEKENKEYSSLHPEKAYETISNANNVVMTEEKLKIQDNIQNKTLSTIVNATSNSQDATITDHKENFNESLQFKDNVYKIVNKRRFPNGLRKKQRIKPMVNTTMLKNQLSRDLIALSTRKYIIHRNASKDKQWKDVNSLITKNNLTNDEVTNKSLTTTSIPDDTTLHVGENYLSSTTSMDNFTISSNTETESINTDTTPFVTTSTDSTIFEIINVTERPTVTPIIKLAINNSTLRRQVYNNRLKKKRLQQKNSTTQQPPNDEIKNIFGMTNLVSASEFIARTQKPKLITTEDHTEFSDILEDFMTTTIKSSKPNNHMRSTRISTTSTTSRGVTTLRTVEETAKNEIEEILNDTRTSARLSKILQERNMTINELVEHRERGSSHIHLADIFHNASKEPNPPEPFLSKSAIEPISKETYPLRALLEANLHDPKATTVEPNLAQMNSVNIPVIMNFGNNVNENGENMGILALFNKIDGDNDTDTEKKVISENTQGKLYIPTIININTTATTTKDQTREYRMIDENQDIVSWNEIFTLVKKNYSNETEGQPLEIDKKFTLDEDVDGDGLIVLEDLQNLNDFGNNIASVSDEKLQVNIYNRVEQPKKDSGILNNIPNSTKSVTVATASIVGLAMILFLLTYAAFKWRQQRLIRKKENICDDRIHTPVFENRKFHKNNSSSRSISPMLSSSNIYTLNTLDSHRDKDSPDYMWETLRKPFQ